MAEKEKKILEKKGWRNSFELVGEVKLYDNTFRMNQHSEKSDWIYNQMFLSVYCGDKSGNVSCECNGGYGANRDNVIFCYGKKEDGSTDSNDKLTIAWDDRKDPKILEDVGSGSFYRVALEKDEKGRTFTKMFLHTYDFIEYLQGHLTDGMTVRITGNIKYDVYNGKVRVKKEVRNVYLFTPDTTKSGDYHHATFEQTFLLGKDSCKDFDKKTGIINVDAIILEYFKTFNGYEVKGNVPLHHNMELKLNFVVPSPEDTPEKIEYKKKMANEFFKKHLNVKRGYNEVRWTGDFVESGSVHQLTEDDLSDDVKMLIAMGIRTLEETLQETASNGERIQKMVLKCPSVIMEDGKANVCLPIERKYEEEDLMLDCLVPKEEDDEEIKTPFDEDDESEDMKMLKEMGMTNGSDFGMNKPETDDDDDWLKDLNNL